MLSHPKYRNDNNFSFSQDTDIDTNIITDTYAAIKLNNMRNNVTCP